MITRARMLPLRLLFFFGGRISRLDCRIARFTNRRWRQSLLMTMRAPSRREKLMPLRRRYLYHDGYHLRALTGQALRADNAYRRHFFGIYNRPMP